MKISKVNPAVILEFFEKMKDRLFLMDILRLVFLKMGGVVEKMVGMMGGIEMVHKCLLPCCSGVL